MAIQPGAVVAVPAKQYVDPPIFGPVRLGHVLRGLPVFVLVYAILHALLPHLPLVAILVAGAAAVALNAAHIRHVPLDRWLLHVALYHARPRRYATAAQREPGAKPSGTLLPVLAIETGCVQSRDRLGTLRAAFILQVRPANYAMMNDDERRATLGTMAEILTGSQHDLQLLCNVHPFDPGTYFENFLAALRAQPNMNLRKWTVHYLDWLEQFTKKHQVLDRDFYVIASSPAGTEKATSAEAIQRLRSTAESICNSFKSVGAEVEILTTQDALQVLQASTNPRAHARTSKLAALLRHHAPTPTSHALAVPDVAVARDHLQVGLDHVRLLVPRAYPEALGVAWLEDILALRERIDVSIHLEPKDPALVRRRLRTGVIDLKGRIARRDRSGYDVSEDARQLEDLEQQLAALAARRTRYFETTLVLALHATSSDALERLTDDVRNRLRSIGVEAFAEDHTQLDAWTTTLPLGLNRVRAHSQTMDTACATALYPFLTSATRHESGNLVGFHAQTGAPFLVDAWRYPNHNVLVVGTSGSGKSYSVKLDLLRTLMHKPDAWIYCVDPLREFGPATQAMGGQVVYLGNVETVLNPFELAHTPDDPQGRAGAPRENPYLWKLSMLGVFFDVLLPALDGFERSVLLLSLQDAFASAGIGEDPATHGRQPPTLATFCDLLRQNAQDPRDPRRAQASQNLATYLQPLLAGPLRGLVGQTTVNLRSNVVTFDLKSLDRQWFGLYMHVVMDFIERRFCQDTSAEKRLVVDEAWNLLGHESTAKALDRQSRHFRHYRAGLTLVTQTPQSFLQTEHGQAILSNCLQTFLFRQRHVSREVMEAYGLEQEDADLLTRMGTGETIRHSECLFIAGNNKSYLAVFASPAEDAIVRSLPPEQTAGSAAA